MYTYTDRQTLRGGVYDNEKIMVMIIIRHVKVVIWLRGVLLRQIYGTHYKSRLNIFQSATAVGHNSLLLTGLNSVPGETLKHGP